MRVETSHMKKERNAKPLLSLRARGVQLLAQREHSVSELRQKLQRHACLMNATAQSLGSQGESVDQADKSSERSSHQVSVQGPEDRCMSVIESAADAVADTLGWLQEQGYLSDGRFAESRVRVRSARFGNFRIKQELAQHQIELNTEAVRALQASELVRAFTVFQRKFPNAKSQTDIAKQARFLTQRGFSSDIIRQVLRAVAKHDFPQDCY
jgi:regulatory protein